MELRDSDGLMEFLEQFNISSNSSLCLDENDELSQDCVHMEANGVSVPSFVLILTQIMYCLIFCAGIFGNTLVIYVVLRYPSLHTVTNTYILNLAIADECFLIGVPFLVVTMVQKGWMFGSLACTLYMVSTCINQMTSSLFLTVLSADRYLAVCHPITSPRLRTPLAARLVSVSTWLVSLVLMLPVFLFSRTVSRPDGATTCNIVWSGLGLNNHTREDLVNQQTVFTFYSFAFGFAGPSLLILTFYGLVMFQLWCSAPVRPTRSASHQRLQRRVTRLILTVITVYIICWLPHWVIQIVLLLSPPDTMSDLLMVMILLSSCLQYANSAINPVLYAFLSDHFKKSFRSACLWCVSGGERSPSRYRPDLTFTTRRTRRGPAFTAVVQEETRTKEVLSTHLSSVCRSPDTTRHNQPAITVVSGHLAPPRLY